MNILRDTLKEIGLKENEITIYLTSLSIGAQPASILGKKTNISRSNTQYICTKLVEKGLLNSLNTKAGNIYSPENPEKIVSMLGKEYNILDKKMGKAHSIVSELKNIKSPILKVPKVKYFTGVDGIINMFEDVFEENKDIYGAIEIPDDINPDILKYLNTEYMNKRTRSNIKTKVLFNNNYKTKKYRLNDKKVNRISLLVPKKLFPFNTCLHIYGNKIAYFSYKNSDLTGVIIENENIKNSLLSIFKMAWIFAKELPENKIYKNIEL